MFPQFNIHSTPLLILVIQGMIFAVLLLMRYRSRREAADAIMAGILLIMVYHRTAYTIGFMGWYDTYTNTKVNYFLISMYLALGPLIYLYVRTTIASPFKFFKRDLWHFLPAAIFIVYRLILLIYDMTQPDWQTGYEGTLLREIHSPYVGPMITLMEYSSQLIYYAFTIQLFVRYRRLIKQYFSNTYKVEYNWIRNFLIVYTFLFVYGYITDMVDAFIVGLDYVHRWWVHFFSAIAIVYLGIKAYFTDLTGLHQLTFNMGGSSVSGRLSKDDKRFSRLAERLTSYIEQEKLYLNPTLTLADMASGARMSVNEVSAVINDAFGINFNEWVNRYRVDAVKEKLMDHANDHLSLVAIAFDSGFNSKATFNRVFKQFTGLSPSQFKARQVI